MKAPALDRGVRGFRADDGRARRPLALLPLPGAADRRARVPAARPARARCRPRPSGASTGSPGVGVVAALEVGIVAFLLRARGRAPAAVHRRSSTATCRRSRTRRASAQAFVAMELGFALVAALLFLAWLTDRRVLLWPAFVLALALGSGLSLSSHQARRPRLSGSSSSPTGCTCRRRRSGSAGCSRSALVVWTDRRAAATAFWRFSRDRRAAGRRCVVAAGVYMTFMRLPGARRPLVGRLRAACCW